MTDPQRNHPSTTEADSVRATYAAYDADPARQQLWDPTHPVEVFYRVGRLRALARLLRDERVSFEDIQVLDVGCGYGRSLVDLMALGADPRRLAGIDLLPARIDHVRSTLPTVDARVGDARALPWPDESFGAVVQFTALSSMPSASDREAMVQEIRRVLQPDGAFVSWDLATSYGSAPQGLSRRDLIRLCQPSSIRTIRTGLDPRLAVRLATRAPRLSGQLELLGVASSHLATLIRFA